MKNGKLRRLGSLLALLLVLTCLLSMSAFAGESEEPEDLTGRWGYANLGSLLNPALEPEVKEAELAKLQAIYQDIEAAVANKAADVEIDAEWYAMHTDESDENELLYYTMRLFVADHAEFYWYTGAYGIRTITQGDLVTIEIVFYYEHLESNEEEAFLAAADALLAHVPEDASDYEIALYLHDALAAHIIYDLDWQKEQSAYSAIVDGRAVCAGYARAYQYLLNREGIEAWTVEGVSLEPGTSEQVPHAWNLVWLGDNCYYTDITWDDQGEQLFHAYFNNPLKEIRRDHATYTYVVLPECNHDKEELAEVNYFVQEQTKRSGMIAINDGTTANDFVKAMVKVGDTFVVDTWCISNEFDDVSEWLNHDADQDGYPIASDILGEMKDVFADDPLVQEHFEWNFGFSILGNEVKVTIQVSPYDGLRDYEGYVDTIEDGKLHAYISYRGVDKIAIKTTYETVMVAYYSENDALQEVAFTSIETDGNRRAELTADCPDEFAYCRVFVVGTQANPAPVCGLLELFMPE